MSQASYQSSLQTANVVSRVVRIGTQEISDDVLRRVEEQSPGLLRLMGMDCMSTGSGDMHKH